MAAVQRRCQTTIQLSAGKVSAVRLTLSSSSVFFFLNCHVSSSHQHDVKIAFSLVFSVFQMSPLGKLEVITIHKYIC